MRIQTWALALGIRTALFNGLIPIEFLVVLILTLTLKIRIEMIIIFISCLTMM